MKAVLFSALVASVSAETVRVIARDLVEVRELMPRQSGDASGLDSSQCAAALSSLLPIATSVPTPPADVESALASITITDLCSVPTNLPASVLSELSVYESTVLDWFSSHSAELESALSACPEFTSYLSDAPVCTTGAGSGSGSGKSTATSSGSGTKQTGSSSSSGSNSTSSGSGSTTTGTGSTVSSAAKGVFSAGLVAGAFIAAVLAL